MEAMYANEGFERELIYFFCYQQNNTIFLTTNPQNSHAQNSQCLYANWKL